MSHNLDSKTKMEETTQRMGEIAKFIIKKKYFPFVPAILLTYLFFWLFRYYWIGL